MSGERRQLFERLSSLARPAEKPAPWRSRRNFNDPVGQFTTALNAVHGRVLRVPTRMDALDVLAQELATARIREVVRNTEPALEGIEVRVPEGVQVHRADDYSGRLEAWRIVCARAGAGITGAEALLAETGTVVVYSGAGKSRLVSLLPPVHIIICSETLIKPDLIAWLETRCGDWPANAVLISGPSKTGDIEQTITVGVHGPRQLTTILYRESIE